MKMNMKIKKYYLNIKMVMIKALSLLILKKAYMLSVVNVLITYTI